MGNTPEDAEEERVDEVSEKWHPINYSVIFERMGKDKKYWNTKYTKENEKHERVKGGIFLGGKYFHI